ncbi:MAG: Dabb family protein [Phycisphaeraceae bacterium]|nr:Dabb family protein [Phycisphaeraceae bacterium]
MFEHYVMFKLKEHKASELQPFIARLKQLKDDVPTIRELKVIPNERKGRKSHDLLYIARFDDVAGFEAYMTHPRHVPVIQYVDEICSSVADVDFTTR